MAPLCQNWFIRGAQSAVFYYVSCGPCLSADHQRKRKRDAQESRRKNERIKDRNPDAYTHPPAFGLNMYWQEEMQLGTGLPMMEKKQLQSRRQMKYRRPDEEVIIVDEIDHEEEEDSKGRWKIGEPKAPEVNELHPPVTSFIPQKEEDRRWMKQPPPSTMYMQGKSGVSIVRRVPSKRSRHRADDEISLTKIRAASRQRRGTSSGSDEDADDEEDEEEDYDSDMGYPSKPRAIYTNGSHKRPLQRPGLSTLVSMNSVGRREQTNAENVSPRTSAHSHGSPMSSNESLPSPRLLPHHHTILLSRSHSSNNQDGFSPRGLPIKTIPATRVDSQQDRIADLTLEMEKQRDELGSDVDEHLAKEHMWLGARERPTIGSKRWSTEF
jgi:hypothetical protein